LFFVWGKKRNRLADDLSLRQQTGFRLSPTHIKASAVPRQKFVRSGAAQSHQDISWQGIAAIGSMERRVPALHEMCAECD
jgi:hypothetical protein